MSHTLAMYVPVSASVPIATIVARGSALVGPITSVDTEHIPVYDEGKVLGYANVKTYADGASVAAGRLIACYPTVARSVVLRSELLHVGLFDPDTGITLLDDAKEAVASWLGVNEVEEKELPFNSW